MCCQHSDEFRLACRLPKRKGGTLLQHAACVACVPIIGVPMQSYQFGRIQLPNIPLPRLWFAKGDFVNSAGVFFGVAGVMAFAGVGEIADVHAAVGAVGEGDAHKPRVARAHQIPLVAGGVAATLACKAIVVDAPAVDVVHENIAAIFGRPIVSQINHRAAVRMASAGCVLLRSTDARADGLRIGEM